MSEKVYSEYVYKKDQEIKISKDLFEAVRLLLDSVIEDNRKINYKEYYVFLNSETKKEVKSPKAEDVASGKVIRVPNTEKMLSEIPDVTYSTLGMRAINLALNMEGVHVKNVEDGVAVHYTELKKD